MSHDRFVSQRIVSRWRVRPAFGESARSYLARLIDDGENCSAASFVANSGFETRTGRDLLEALLALPISDAEKGHLIRWTPVETGHRAHLIANHRFGRKALRRGRYCAECILEAPFHRVWWDINGFETCPIHDSVLAKWRADVDWPLYGNFLRSEEVPMCLSQRGLNSIEGYILERLGAVEANSKRPLLEDCAIDVLVSCSRMLGAFLVNPPRSTAPKPDAHHILKGFEALSGTHDDLRQCFESWLKRHHDPATLRRAVLGNFGYFQHTRFPEPLLTHVDIARIEAISRFGILTPRLRVKEGINVPLLRRHLMLETSLTADSIDVLMRRHGVELPEIKDRRLIEIPDEVVDVIRKEVDDLVPIEEVARILGCSPTDAHEVSRRLSRRGWTGCLTRKKNRKATRFYIRRELDKLSAALSALPAPPGCPTVNLRAFSRLRYLGESRVMADVLTGETEAFLGPGKGGLRHLRFAIPQKPRYGGRPARLGRTHVAEGEMLSCEFTGITGIRTVGIKYLIEHGILRSHGRLSSTLDRETALRFHEKYVTPIRYLHGQGLSVPRARARILELGLAYAFDYQKIGAAVVERIHLEKHLGPLHRPAAHQVRLWNYLIASGRNNCPSFIIPEVPGDGETYVYTSTRKFMFRVVFSTQGLTFRITFQPKARRIWKIFSADPDLFRALMPTFDWTETEDEAVATATAVDEDAIDCIAVEIGHLGARFRYKMP